MRKVKSCKNLWVPSMDWTHLHSLFTFTAFQITKHQLMACDQGGSSKLIKDSDILRKAGHTSLSVNPWVQERVWAHILAFPHMSSYPFSTSSKAVCLINNMFGINNFAIVLVSLSLPREGNWQVLSQLLTDLKQCPEWNSHIETNLRAKTSPANS